MALLTVNERKAIFKKLGYTYDKKGIAAIQKEYMLRKKDVDGEYGKDTDNMLRTVWNTRVLTKNFSPKEFRCDCGGRFCCGFPDYMKSNELKHIQKIRTHYGKPITITQGLRCKQRNKELRGSVVNSGHLKGRAVDFYQQGITDTLAHRKKSIKYIKSLPNHKFTYGNGVDSNGYRYPASYMGNALHTETSGGGMAKIPKLTSAKKKTTTTTKKTTTKKTLTNAEKLVAMAKKLAWEVGTDPSVYKYPSGSATKEFETAIAKAYPYKYRKKWGAAPRVGASCDVFAGTVIKYLGLDPRFPRGLEEQMVYKSSKWTRYVYKNIAPIRKAKPGDVVIYVHSNGTHIVIVGNGCYYEANYKREFGHVNTSNRLSTKFKKVIILRPKG